MKILSYLSSVIVAVAGLSFTACERETEAERTGDAIEDATDGAAPAIEEAGDEVEEATD